MPEKWREIAKKNISIDDSIRKSFPATFNNKYGHLMFSNKKILFVAEEGWFNKNYILTLSLNVDEINDINFEDDYNLYFIDNKEKKYVIKTDFPAKIVKDNIMELYSDLVLKETL